MPRKKIKLIVKRINDEPFEKGIRTKGRTTGISLFDYVAGLLAANEQVSRDRKLNDATLVMLAAKEFPNSKTLQKLVSGGLGFGYYRTLYNRGQLTKNENGEFSIPKVLSVRYNANGDEIQNGTGRKPITRIPGHSFSEKKRVFNVSREASKENQVDKPHSTDIEETSGSGLLGSNNGTLEFVCKDTERSL